MTEFTKGPWRVEPDVREERNGYSGDNISYVSGLDIRSDTSEIIGCEGISGDGHAERANANLIAAAPDLYEAIRRMQKIILDGDLQEMVSTLFWEISSTALAKARGAGAL